MKSIRTYLLGIMTLLVVAVSAPAFAQDVTHSTPGASGYDVVAYFTDGKPMRGSGYHVAVINEADRWLHLGLAVAMLMAAVVSSRQRAIPQWA